MPLRRGGARLLLLTHAKKESWRLRRRADARCSSVLMMYEARHEEAPVGCADPDLPRPPR